MASTDRLIVSTIDLLFYGLTLAAGSILGGLARVRW